MIINLEKQAWEAWKNKNGAFFQGFMTDDAVLVSGAGVTNKASVIKDIVNPQCDVKSSTLGDFNLVMVEKDAARLTYSAKQDFTCNGKAGPPSIWATSVFVKRGGKWYNILHQEAVP